MASFTQTNLFGGAMSCEIPQGYMDSSIIRQVPDHQEIYLSNKTLTNIIIEINERVGHDDNIHDDFSAAKYHIRDICSDDDTFDESEFHPQPTTLGKIRAATSAYYGQVRIVPRDGQALGAEEFEKKTTTCYYLLVRLEEKTTDILVLVNVPQTELVVSSGALEGEKVFGSTILEKVIQSLEIKDMSLFG